MVFVLVMIHRGYLILRPIDNGQIGLCFISHIGLVSSMGILIHSSWDYMVGLFLMGW